MSKNWKAGDWVEVLSKEEILGTLDERGQLDAMPFMPEMEQYCGRRFQVWTRAHKTCDTVTKTGGRWLPNAVHLKELRCDGSGHGGCQAGCLLYWKTAWLKSAPSPEKNSDPEKSRPSAAPKNAAAAPCRGCSDAQLIAGTRAPGQLEDPDPNYVCQATQVPAATRPLAWWDVRQYFEDYISGNFGLGRIFSGLTYATFVGITRRVGGPTLRKIYDRTAKLRRGWVFPRRMGTVPEGQRTPTETLDLQPGEQVQMKSYEEILATLDSTNKNRGLYFDAEEVPYCGGTYTVRSRVKQIINEQTGKMMHFKTESVILEGVYCKARYSDRRMLCPRAVYPMFREVWLTRAKANGLPQNPPNQSK